MRKARKSSTSGQMWSVQVARELATVLLTIGLIVAILGAAKLRMSVAEVKPLVAADTAHIVRDVVVYSNGDVLMFIGPETVEPDTIVRFDQ